jgi:hypothetical protein
MSEFPRLFSAPDPLVHIMTSSMCALGSIPISGNSIGNNTWFSANAALFVPFRLSRPFVFNTIFVISGTASGNIDVGVYSADGTRLVSKGSTAMAGTSVVQSFAVTSTTLGPGQFYFAAAIDNTTGSVAGLGAGAGAGIAYEKMFGMAQMASAFPLPATATFATVTTTNIPHIGITGRSVI